MSGKDKTLTTDFIYSSSEMAKFYGLTNKAIQFYEEKGLLHPQKIGSGNIRRYDLSDSYSLYYTRLYHNCGVGVTQVMDLLENNTPEHITGALSAQMDRIEKEIQLRQHTLSHMREIHAAFRNALDHPGVFTATTEQEGFYRLFLRRFAGVHTSNARETEEYRTWNQLLPITGASLFFPKQELEAKAQVLDTQIGLLIREADFRRFDLCHSDRVTYYPGGRFVRGVIAFDSLKLGDAQMLAPALDFIRENGLRLRGGAFTRLLYVIKEGGANTRYDEIYLPVE